MWVSVNLNLLFDVQKDVLPQQTLNHLSSKFRCTLTRLLQRSYRYNNQTQVNRICYTSVYDAPRHRRNSTYSLNIKKNVVIEPGLL